MILWLLIGFQIIIHASLAEAIEIPDTPLSVMVESPPPIIMFLIDDSSSMNDSILALSNNNVLSNYHYVFKDPENHVLTSLTHPQTIIPPEKKQSWQARCCITNRMYYNPEIKYDPWPYWQTILNNAPDAEQANPDCPKYHPMKSACQNLDDSYLITDSFRLSYSHLFIFDDKNTNAQLDGDEQLILIELSGHQIHAYEVIDPQSEISMPNLKNLSFSQIPDSIALNASGQPMTYTMQRQNFANWFSFHRRKELRVRYHLGDLLDRLTTGWIGLYSMNRALVASVCQIDNTRSGFENNKNNLLKQIYTYTSYGDSPLRQAYQEIGNYLDSQTHSIIGTHSPFNQNMEGDRCRLAFAIVLTDGQYNGPSPNIGNRDCDTGSNDTSFDGSYFSDPYENTFADVAMFYYERDLAPEIPNGILAEPTHQHMIPLIVHFASTELAEIYTKCPPNCSQWPEPLPGSEQTIIDLYHASINGRGLFFNANNPNALDQIFHEIAMYIQDKQTVVSNATLTGKSTHTQTQFIETSFYSGDWTGDVQSYNLDSNNNPQTILQWSAKSVLARQSDRTIITYNGQSGIPFHADRIDSSEMSDRTIKHISNLPLGSIIHSTPVVVGNTIWVASNDSMVHAFDSETGYEKLAYIPKILWPRLHLLHTLTDEHHYFIDGNLYVYQKNDCHLICGTLGRGGKGLFCLNIGEKLPQNMPMWEYAPLNDPDLGHIQQAYIVESNCNNIPVVIFGNGYNSDNKQGYLYILNALTGKPLQWNGQDAPKGIALPASGIDNGLSTPALVDVDSNQTVDFIYAGDFQGNIWKFDCQSSNPNKWHVFFKNAYDNQPYPLFQSCAANGQVQPILIRPEVIRHCDSRFMGYLIMWGTGKYLEQHDIIDKSTQSLYCIWDGSDYWQKQRNYNLTQVRHSYLGSFNTFVHNQTGIRKPEHTPPNVTLQKRNFEQSANSIQPINWDPTAAQSHVGWFMDMAPGERVVFPFTCLGESFYIVNTLIPNNVPCKNGGNSKIYIVDSCNGQIVNDVFKNLGMSVFCNPIDGILYPPLVQYYGSNEIMLYFPSSISSNLMPVFLNANDINGMQHIFDGQIFYWKSY
jgi:outer membrane protein assembly factor BamB